MRATRGTLAAQLEAAVAATHRICKDESETAAQYREEARKLFEAKDYVGARAASKTPPPPTGWRSTRASTSTS